MTTITMTFRQLQKECCDWHENWHNVCRLDRYKNCTTTDNCPIWRRAEKREAKKV